MSAQRFRTLFRGNNLFPLTFALLFLVVVAFGFASSTAQSPAKEAEAKDDKRQIETRIAPHLPFKLKFRNEEKLKDLKNEDWLGDVEVEIINTGTKPIYYLYIAMLLPEGVSTVHDKGIVYSVRYGRIQLVDMTEPLRSDDVPILPGESAVIKLPAEKLTNWKSLRAKGKVLNPKKLSFWFQVLNHGDGTGFLGPDGVPLPNKDTRRSDNRCRDGKLDVANLKSARPPSPQRLVKPSSYFSLSMPVNFVAGNFFAPSGPPRRAGPRHLLRHLRL